MTRICLIYCDTLEEGETHRDYLTLKFLFIFLVFLFISPCCPSPKLAKGLGLFANVLPREKSSTTKSIHRGTGKAFISCNKLQLSLDVHLHWISCHVQLGQLPGK